MFALLHLVLADDNKIAPERDKNKKKLTKMNHFNFSALKLP